MKKQVIVPVAIALVVAGGAGLALAGESDTNPDQTNNNQAVQGASNVANTDASEQQSDESTTATQPSAPSTTGQNTQTQTNTQTTTPTTTSEQPTNDTQTNNDTSTPQEPTPTRGDSQDGGLEIIDVVPVPVDDGNDDDNNGGPTIDQNPVRGPVTGPVSR